MHKLKCYSCGIENVTTRVSINLPNKCIEFWLCEECYKKLKEFLGDEDGC